METQLVSKAAPTAAKSDLFPPNLATAEDPSSSVAVPLMARTHCTAVFADDNCPPDETCPKIVITGHTLFFASISAVLLSELVGSLPYA